MDRPATSGGPPTRRSPRTSALSLSSASSVNSGSQNGSSPSPAPSRTRPKTSSGETTSRQASIVPDRSSARGSKDSLKARLENTSATPSPSGNVKLLETLQDEFKNIRDLITCQICYSLLYEPYTTACGHTFCYNCFCKTFEPHREKKCPECRTELRYPPAPAFLLRQITHQIAKQPDLLPEGELLDTHLALLKEQEQLVKKDKEGPHGLFKGLFAVPRLCPLCSCELDHNMCPQCGIPVPQDANPNDPHMFDDWSENTASDEQEDFDMTDLDLEGDFGEGGESVYDEWSEPSFPYDDDDAMPHIPFHYRQDFDEYLADSANYGDFAAMSRAPASHSLAASTRRRSYAESSLSSYGDTEMNAIEEEDDDEGSVAGDSVSGAPDGYTSGEQPIGATSISSSNSTPPQLRATATSTAGRRRQRESNTPTSSMGGPRQRRRIGSVVNLSAAAMETIESPHASEPATQASSETSSQADTGSTSSGEDDTSGPSNTSGQMNGYVSLENGIEDDSDGAETTVGWGEPSSQNPRSRTGGSLTPTLDRPFVQLRTSNFGGSPRFSNLARGLRHRSSSLSQSTAPHDGNEADVSDTEPDNIGHSRQRALRQRRSRILRQPSVNSMYTDGLDESDDTDPALGDESAGSRQRSIDPEIARRFAQHAHDLRNGTQTPANLSQIDQLRDLNRTPGINRPRTQNRSRTGTPSMGQNFTTSPARLARQEMLARLADRDEPQRRQTVATSNPSVGRQMIDNWDLDMDVLSANSMRSQLPPNIPSPSRSRVANPPHFAIQTAMDTHGDSLDRPESRVSQRPPSASSRRNSTARTSWTLGTPAMYTPGLNAARTWSNGNPFIPRQQAADRPSIATLRPVPSVREIRRQSSRNNMPSAPPFRPPSRTNSRNQQRSLNHTPSMAHLPQSNAPSISYVAYVNPPAARRVPFPAPTQPDEDPRLRISAAMALTREQIARRQGQDSSDTTTGSSRPPPIAQHPDLQSLRNASANPFVRQTPTSSAFSPPMSHRDIAQHPSHVANSGSISISPRVSVRRSNQNLRPHPPGILFSTNAGVHVQNQHALSIASQAGTAANTGSPRLARQRSRGTGAPSGTFIPASSSLHTSVPQPRQWGGVRSPANALQRSETRNTANTAHARS
ncbi:hypothetical protein BT63DRAFT_48037 [Microthyrium microscopicum]|uniref:RING-type domain-containing protein n=1 Tax=Microthyrium microscopicum TaxID=703497 RepID=A0A6A6U356_9PEZI|nr:hypothetical protein BT63DRAFT_48037 [Microthyrium microscopicum]